MSKLSEKTVDHIARKACINADQHGMDHEMHQTFHKLLDGKHPLSAHTQNRIAIYGNSGVAKRLIEQPKLHEYCLHCVVQEHPEHAKEVRKKFPTFPGHYRPNIGDGIEHKKQGRK